MEWIRIIFYEFGLGSLSLSISVLLIILGLKPKRIRIKQLLFNFSALFIVIFLFELYHSLKKEHNDVSFDGTYKGNFFVSGDKPEVGFGPYEDTTMTVSAIKIRNGNLLYNVNYTLKNGKRYVPNNNDKSNHFVHFLGCSFIFGDGLNDNQTLPYFFNKYSENNFNSINHAFSGYGPHQALRICEKELSKDKYENNTAIYLLLPSHIDRAAGLVAWDKYGPKYDVENDSLVFKGPFKNKNSLNDSYIINKIKSSWEKSALYNSFFKPKLTKNDALRVFEIINHMHKILSKNNIRFILLIQTTESTGIELETYNHLEKIIYDKLSKTNVEYYFIGSVISDFKNNITNYKISGDGHPNENYNREVGKFLANLLQENKSIPLK